MSADLFPTVKQDLQSAKLVLVSLKHDHEQVLTALDGLSSRETSTVNDRDGEVNKKIFNSEKIPLIKTALSQIQDGLDESELILTFANYMECLEAEIMKLRLHNQRLCEEASWLRNELKHTQGKLIKNEAILVQTATEKQKLEFLMELSKLDGCVEKKGLDHSSSNHGELNFHSKHFPSSVGDWLSASKHSPSSSVATPGAFGYLRDGSFHPMACSQTIDVSSMLNSSLTDADLNIWSCTQSFHPSLLGPTDQKSSKKTSVPPNLRTLHQIVVQYTTQGKHEVAAALCTQAISDFERNGGRNQADVAVLLNILALVYRDQGKYDEAAELLQNVLTIREGLFGSTHPLVAASLNNLAVVHAKAGRFSDAEPLCRRALAIREKLLGPNHLDVAKQLNNLALLCQSQGQFEEVESCLRKALTIYQKSYKPASPIVLRAKNNLASALLKRGNLADAEILLKDVLSPERTNPVTTRPTNSLLSSPNPTEVDSAVFSADSSCNGFIPVESDDGASTVHTISASAPLSIPPLWLLAEQAGLERRGQLTKFNISAWASEARIDISLVLSAVRNLSIIYQRQGHTAQANLLRSWIQPIASPARTSISGTTIPVTPELSKTAIPPQLAISACLPCPSAHSSSTNHPVH